MTEWSTDAELFELCERELYTAVVGDICDQMGLRTQFLGPEIRPLRTGAIPVMVGRAMPVLEADVFSEAGGARNDELDLPFGRMLEALDHLQSNEIYVCAGASPEYALVGELMCTAMRARGAVGVVCDGYIRDADRILDMEYPVFSYGPYGQDQRGRGKVIDYRVPIEINGVRIHPGDLLVGDIDGVLAVPQNAEEEVFGRALEKVRGEDTVREALRNGMSATEAFDTYGIL
jgi:regulator of RNase E activity RraA